jgi:hypothetical protein
MSESSASSVAGCGVRAWPPRAPTPWPPRWPARAARRRYGLIDHDVVPRTSYADLEFDDLLADWRWASLYFNAVNHAMGKGDLYPFVLVDPVVERLAFVHQVVRETGRITPRPILN